jgi:Flp pilus assembly protein TadB
MKNRIILSLIGILFLSGKLFANETDKKESNAPTALVAHLIPEEPQIREQKQENKPQKPEVAEKQMPVLEKKEVKEKIREIREEVKQIKREARENKGNQGWDPKFKIGTILIAIAVLLAIVGIGWVAGLAALVGLFFVVVGLLHTYS